ncbi:hypothetical protein AGOR_G00151370 [Albula goreensis]|uniref:Caveolin n=1 Tax=Albula goreensis TaxID=1534307 RepID=A0A8T3D3E3_9TELE|nr:hypothetical protein AGOR_G00151370 [Albula goreensis]
MVSDEYLVECKIDDDEEDEEENKLQETPPPPPQFSSAMPPEFSDMPPLSQLESRDPYGINQHLKVEFCDVLAEPVSPHSCDRVWVYSSIGFESARLWSYRVLTLLLAVPVSLLSGCLFACVACLHIWCVMPCVQVFHSCLPCVRSLWLSVVNIFIAPLCTSMSRCCASIYVSLSKD